MLLAALASGSAAAGPALDDDKKPPVAPVAPVSDAPDCSAAGTDPRCAPAAAAPAAAAAEDEVEYGIGIRARSVWIPKSVLQLFVDRAAGGAHNYGIGVDLTRRRGNSELQLGFEWEHVNVGEGVWINKGDNVADGPNGMPGDESDWILSPAHSGNQFGWFTVEFTFLNHAEITKWLAFRYGAGLGIGVLVGELDHYNIICHGATNAMPEPGCVPPNFGGNGTFHEGTLTQVAYDLPPVFPVVNAILGLQFKPTDKWTINLEGGIRTLPFLGFSSSVFF